MVLRRALRSGVAAACIASVAAPAGIVVHATPAAAQARGGPNLRVAATESFSRIEVRGEASARREGQTVVLTFAPGADPDVARLRTAPPRWVKAADRRVAGGRPELVLTLADDADARIGRADGALYVNVFEKVETSPEADAEPVAVAEAEPPRPDPLPPGGVVKMDAKVAGGQTQLSFAFANPAGAAVFRRGDAVWVVFDAPANLDVSGAPPTKFLRGLQSFRGADHAALRIEADSDTPVFASVQGDVWTVALGPGPQAAPAIVRVSRDSAGGPATLRAPVAGATRIVNLPDPVVGDTLTVVTALGPPKGVPSRRDFVGAALLPSIQGLAVEATVDDLSVRRDGEIVRIGRARGLNLSPAWAGRDRERAQLGAPQAAAMPALVSADWSKTGEDGFVPRYESLLAAAAAEGASNERGGPVAARMALARFLVGSELSFEAIGVLNALARAHPEMLDDPEFRGLRGIARTMSRRYAEADTDFSAPALADDPSTSLWRAYLDTQLAQYAEARTQFTKGAEAFGLFSPIWKSRFARADAQAALAQGDLAGAESRIRLALEERVDPEERLRTRLVHARIIEMNGYKDRALRVYNAIATAPLESIAAPALLRATQIRLELGQVTPVQAVGVFDSLRYRWRGDATELETIRALGQLYLAQGRYREALEALRSAGVRLPDLPEAIQLQADLNTAFRALFLDGLADGLEPTQALALFFDFRELAPLGADGDMMVRRIVRRLVDVDLLPQAADLLKYQAENRLDGVPRAQVATDLAVIYLMDRKPEQALAAINGSRTTILPTALNTERRLVEARAWTSLGRYENALEIIERDTGKEAADLRAEILWKQKDWAAAGPLYEKSLGERWKIDTQLSSDEEGRLLRAGVAYSLAGDDAALARLQQRYQGFYEKANNPEALRIALSGLPTGRLSVADFGRVSADGEMFAGWVEKMKGRFKTRAAPTGDAKAPATPARQAAAEPAPRPAAVG
ncbi:endoglucanase [Phenylobacterium sp. SCN 70-31]|uniref:tetratricopeptide repeat protein n=1 Tax=Phenylobacterium sp. SCN 70-31 TaxID=1660129 RepID=UPI00086BC5FC|nr:endoglucanase [Phenylobacterium sp. SCN 70-31]ODT88692.1 MAG: endoglucanase [Phenylobacterium sp. SCN 70-31]